MLQQKHALSPLSSGPSTVSENNRYASKLATEASSVSSEPEPGSDSDAELDDSGGSEQATADQAARDNKAGKEFMPAGPETGDSHPAVIKKAGSAAGKAEPARLRAALPHSRAESAVSTASTCSAKLQAHLRAQHPFHPLTARTAVRPAQSSPQAAALQKASPVADEEEEVRLVASSQRLGIQLGSPRPGSIACDSGLSQDAVQAQHAEQSGSGRGPSPARHSRRHDLLTLQQKPIRQQVTNDWNKATSSPSTPDVRPASRVKAKTAGKGHGGRAARLATGQPDRQACLSDSSACHSHSCGRLHPAAGVQAGSVFGGRQAAAKTANGAGKPGKVQNMASSQAVISNSAEQQLLQQSLAKLDVRLTSLAARCAGPLCCLCCLVTACCAHIAAQVTHTTLLSHLMQCPFPQKIRMQRTLCFTDFAMLSEQANAQAAVRAFASVGGLTHRTVLGIVAMNL